METLNKLFKDFYKPSPQVDLNAEIEENHKELIQTLSKADRRKVLKIIDNLMMITTLQTEESFICGLRLGLGITTELKHYNQGGYVSESTEVQPPFAMEVQTDEYH
ncbi:DUF6809 family protein [Chakrabartyella piscis]|uniref:DUF6809 family protein n=1 Tax=Chakrabartyella piscis TaxID=2918914 RepID=UPI0029583F19|nr:DUF6809 family protein [Chakrabartyella piscis]